MNILTILLSDSGAFSLITPDPGLAIWSVIIFVLLWIILGKFAFKPIVKALKEREQNIEQALRSAELAKAEMSKLVSQNEALLIEAKEERNRIIAEAKAAAEKVKNEIIAKAQAEADQKLQMALREIDNQKRAALAELKNQVGEAAMQIAEKVIRKELRNNPEQQKFVEEQINQIHFN
ncbi:MAG: F0F1 ATP synthase subunit B [Chitinophagales bacterium]|nr:F0F1 ATP synthase subunit B [Chitinophagales bacterium]MDW8273485.1 F0F1 ATP synthase subunit B [Chitinophagales bacterium]